MKSLLLVVVLFMAGFTALGLYMGWFRFTTTGEDNRTEMTLTMDKDKMEKDKDDAVNVLHDVGRQAKDKAPATAQKAQD